MDDWELQALAVFVADYITEEQARGNIEIDKYMVRDAIDAYLSKDDPDADAANNPKALGQILGA